MADLTTLADIKAYLGIPPGDTTYDFKLEIFRKSVEASVMNFCDTSFSPTVKEGEIHDGVQGDVLVPKGAPIVSVQKVIINCDADGNGGSELLAGQDYYNDEVRILLVSQHTPFGRGSVRIDYTWGYATVPADVTLAIYQGVQAEKNRDEQNNIDVASIRKQDESISYIGAWDPKSGLPKAVSSKLQPYRNYGFFNGNEMAQRNW